MTRSELIEAMARAVDPLAYAFGSRPDLRHQPLKNQGRALTALEAAIPGLSDLLDGTAVVVPREPTREMILPVTPSEKDWMGHADARPETIARWRDAHVSAAQKAYAAMIAASPYGDQHE